MTSIAHLRVFPDLSDPAWHAAFRSALASLGTHAPAIVSIQRDGDGTPVAIWLDVPSWSEPGQSHRVLFADGGVICRCPAGGHGKPCWHAAAVWLWLNRESRLADPTHVRIALNQYTDPERIARERARIEAALAGVLA